MVSGVHLYLWLVPVPIYNEVKKLRTEKSLTQEELGGAVGVSRQTIVAIEKGNYTPSLMLALMLAKFFKVSVEQLFRIK